MERLIVELKNADHSNNALFASLVIRVPEADPKPATPTNAED